MATLGASAGRAAGAAVGAVGAAVRAVGMAGGALLCCIVAIIRLLTPASFRAIRPSGVSVYFAGCWPIAETITSSDRPACSMFVIELLFSGP